MPSYSNGTLFTYKYLCYTKVNALHGLGVYSLMKKFSLLFIIICIIFLLSSCAPLFLAFIAAVDDDLLSKSQISSLVNKNETILREDINNNNFERSLQIKGISNVNSSRSIIIFSCGGAGFGSATSYYGFCYVTNDSEINGLWGNNVHLYKDGDGYSYSQSDGDNYFYIEKICKNFFYYEEHY